MQNRSRSAYSLTITFNKSFPARAFVKKIVQPSTLESKAEYWHIVCLADSEKTVATQRL